MPPRFKKNVKITKKHTGFAVSSSFILTTRNTYWQHNRKYSVLLFLPSANRKPN